MGERGRDGRDGRDGGTGQRGDDGRDGLSAYELAVRHGGFRGDVGAWLRSLEGRRGPAGGEKGDNGRDGRELRLSIVADTIKWQYSGDTEEEWRDLVPLESITGPRGAKGDKGKDGRNGRNGKDGADGRDPEMTVTDGYIAWRLKGDTAWIGLIALAELKGEKGDKGDPGPAGRRAGGGGVAIGSFLPAGGTAGQVLTKNSATQGDASWQDAAGGVTDAADVTFTPAGSISSTNVQAAIEELDAGIGTAAGLAFDTDGTLTANSDSRIATQKAVKTYADQLIAAADAMVFKGVIDCSANPDYPEADRGWTYRVSVAGKIGGAGGTNVEAGDLLICLTDGTASGTQAAVGSSWTITQANLDGAVIGPSSATDGHVVLFNGTTGKIIKDSGLTLSGTNTGDETATSVATILHAATGKTTPVDADELPLIDSAASNALKKLTWANLKATLLAYFGLAGGSTGQMLAKSSGTDLAFTWTTPANPPSPITDTPSSDQNDYAPTGWSTCTQLRLNPSTSIVITGFSAGTAGEIKTISNVASDQVVVIAHQNAGSTAANRAIVCLGAERGHLILFPSDSASFIYDGTQSRWVLQATSARNPMQVGSTPRGWVNSITNASTLIGLGISTGSGTTRSFGTGSYRAQTSRIGYVTSASAGNVNHSRISAASLSRGDAAGRGGFIVRTNWAHETWPTTGAAMFCGVLSSTSAIGNVDPSSLTNIAGFAKDAGDTNMQWMYNDGSGTASKVDLGSNFPLDTTATYRSTISSTPGGSGISYVIERLDDLTIAPKAGYVSSDIPSSSTFLSWQLWVGNRAVAQAFSMDPNRMDLWQP